MNRNFMRTISGLLTLVFSLTCCYISALGLEEASSASGGTYVLDEGFEDGAYIDNFQDLFWGNSIDQRTPPTITTAEHYAGSNCLELDALDAGSGGIMMNSTFPIGDNTIYEITCKVKGSEDYTGELSVGLYLYDGSTQLSVNTINGEFNPESETNYGDLDYDVEPGKWEKFTVTNGEWTEYKYTLLTSIQKDNDVNTVNNYRKIDESVIDGAKLYFISRTADDTESPSGKLYLDDIKIKLIEDELAYPPRVYADDNLFWYVLGDTITLTPTKTVRSAVYPSVKGYFYDAYGNLADTKTVSAEEFNSGFKWTPSKAGFYEYEFALIDTAGVEHVWKEWYKNRDIEPIYYYRSSLIVTPHETKPMSERRAGLGATLSPRDYLTPFDEVELADRLGMSMLRMHAVEFGSPSSTRGDRREIVADEKGVYDFSYYNDVFKQATDEGFDKLQVTFFNSPEWANPARDPDTGAILSGQGPCPPINNSVYESYIRAAAENFKGVVDKYELFNEPGLPGQSIFWTTTVDKYMQLHKIGYDTIKAVDPDAVVSYERPMSEAFTRECFNQGIYDYFDELDTHGTRGEQAYHLFDQWGGIYPDYGVEAKPYNNSEMHAILRRIGVTNQQIGYSELDMAIVAIKAYLIAFKSGCRDIVLWGTTSFGEDIERLRWFKANNNSGCQDNSCFYIFRPLDIPTPRMAAWAVFNFLDQMGKDYSYVNEAKFSEQNMVRMKNDGEEQLLVWLDRGSEAQMLSSYFWQYAGDDFKIVDWQYNEIDTSNLSNVVLQPETMYYITGVNSTKLDELPDGFGLSPAGKRDMRYADVLFHYDYRGDTEVLDPTIVIPEAQDNGGKIFDSNTFTLYDGEGDEPINWISTDFNWVALDTTYEQDIDAEYAIHVDEDGMQLVARVHGDNDYNPNIDNYKMWQKDSLQFGIDVTGDGIVAQRVEYILGKSNGQTTLYKEFMPDDDGFVLGSTITKAGNPIPSSNAKYAIKTQNTENGTDILYFVELPIDELWSYNYPAHDPENNPLRFSLLINQNSYNSRVGYLEWSSGIGGDKAPKYYGKINFAK